MKSMKTVALVSGGKDSCFNMMCCIAEGHDVVALANLRPETIGEVDSYMYQSVGTSAVDLYAEAMGVKLYTRVIKGASLSTGQDYQPLDGDEVEDLYELLHLIQLEKQVEAVSVGAIFSDYQRVRVENVCQRLGLTVLSFLWRREQEELLREMVDCGVRAKIIKVAALGLMPDKHLGLDISEILPHMIKMRSMYGLNVCGEGGEYETFVCDCPLFKKKIIIDKSETVIHSDDAFAPVAYLNLTCHLESKDWDPSIPLRMKLLALPITTSHKWVEKHNVEAMAGRVGFEKYQGGGGAENNGVTLCQKEIMIYKNCPAEGMVEPLIQNDHRGRINITGLRGFARQGRDITFVAEEAMLLLKENLNFHCFKMRDVVSMSLYLRDMSDFAAVNKAYKTFFGANPPVRVCIQAQLPLNIPLQLDCQGRQTEEIRREEERRVMHVQGLSHWAPANIGPYSQAVLVGEKLYLAGIVPLVPATLDVVEGGITVQCHVALTHVQNVMRGMDPLFSLIKVRMGICYVTSADYIPVVKETFYQAFWAAFKESENLDETLIEERDRKNKECHMKSKIHLQFVVVSALPKGCLVEWHIYAWPYTDLLGIKDNYRRYTYGHYTLQARSMFSEANQELLSCHMTVELNSMDDLKWVDDLDEVVNLLYSVYLDVIVSTVPSHVLRPLIKIFFSPAVFDYAELTNSFEKRVSPMLHSMSMIPIVGLERREQILVWCQ